LVMSAITSSTEPIPKTDDEPQERPKLRIV
jgi:hypothetical protein